MPVFVLQECHHFREIAFAERHVEPSAVRPLQEWGRRQRGMRENELSNGLDVADGLW